jgi:hypothetical protein
VIQHERKLIGVSFDFGRRVRPWYNMLVLAERLRDMILNEILTSPDMRILQEDAAGP